MARLREAMPDMALWLFCWNLIWVDVLLDENRSEKFAAGMEGWEELIPD